MEERLVEILALALQFHVSDIHFTLLAKEDGSESLTIEMRVHGKMKRLKKDERDIRLFRYLMYRADLDLSSVFLPQTGSFEAVVKERRISLRFAIMAGYHQSSGVLRILNDHSGLSINDLSFDPDTVQYLSHITDHTSGLVVFSGPTGSGKTTSLYTILDAVNGRKIYTLEDPVEVVHERYIQLQVNEKQHMSYAEGIRQLMRHDPDIIMIGEIRDSEAAMMAVRCALTGHLVVTSLHAQDCVSAILRLLELGVDAYQLKDVLTGVLNQRLFEMKDGRKTGIDEFMDRKEVEYWFENKCTSTDFVPLARKLEEAGISELDTAIISKDNF